MVARFWFYNIRIMERNPANRSIGINFTEGQPASVRVWAPDAKEVTLFLSESEKQIQLDQSVHGYWTLSTNEIHPGDLYFFLLDGKQYADPASLSQPQGVHGPSKAVDIKSFTWNDKHWINPALEKYIFYEIHTGTFSEKGNFSGIEEHLDDLVELGITAIEIMPLAQFPGERNWGYDGVFPFAVQNSYGGAEAFQHLVNTCHEKGLAVVLDVVYNHFGPEGNVFKNFGPYFTGKYQTPWGEAINFDDAHSDEVRHFFIENALMWFRDFHIDALRLDAVHAIKDFSPVHLLKEIRLAVDELAIQTGRQYYLIAECDLNDVRYIQGVTEHGYGLDAQWIDEFHHALRVAAGNEKTGYYSDFDGVAHLAKSYRDAYVYDGMYSQHRQRKFGTSAMHQQGKQFVVFSQNHDQVGNRMRGERTGTLVSFEKRKLLAGAVLISPFLPLLFMGEEYGEQNPFLYFVHHSDPALIEAVRKGRQAEFAAFHSQGEAPDPQSEQTFQQSRLRWNSRDEHAHAVLLRYYKKLIALRKQLPALHELNRHHLKVNVDEKTQTLSIERWTATQRVFIALNFSSVQQTLTVPSASQPWTRAIVSSDTTWDGQGQSHLQLAGDSLLPLQGESIAIYLDEYV